MPVTGVTSTSASSATNSVNSEMNSLRSADFMKMILSEITNQDPLQPTDTSKMIEGMQSLIQLANANYTQFRDDVRWAQDLVGQSVNVTQLSATTAEQTALTNKGLKPDIGYGNLTGKVQSFHIVDQALWVTVNGKDYPLSNVKQVLPKINDPEQLSTTASQLLGMRIKYLDSNSKTQEGVVSSVGYDTDGSVLLSVGNTLVPYSNLMAITVPSSTATGSSTGSSSTTGN